MVWPMCMCGRLYGHLWAHAMERLGSFAPFDSLSLLRIHKIPLCNHSLCSVSICTAGNLKKTVDIMRTKIQCASEHANEGDTCMKHAYESRFK